MVYNLKSMTAKLAILIYSPTSSSQVYPFPIHLPALDILKHLNFRQLGGLKKKKRTFYF